MCWLCDTCCGWTCRCGTEHCSWFGWNDPCLDCGEDGPAARRREQTWPWRLRRWLWNTAWRLRPDRQWLWFVYRVRRVARALHLLPPYLPLPEDWKD